MIEMSEYQGFIARSIIELEKPEHGGVRNIIMLAFTKEGEPITMCLDSDDPSSIAVMMWNAQTYFQAYAMLKSNEYVAELTLRQDDIEDIFEKEVEEEDRE